MVEMLTYISMSVEDKILQGVKCHIIYEMFQNMLKAVTANMIREIKCN